MTMDKRKLLIELFFYIVLVIVGLILLIMKEG